MALNTSKIPSTFRDPKTPIRVVIKNQGNDYKEEIHDDDKVAMADRRVGLDKHYKDHWTGRHGKHDIPRYARPEHHDHEPVTALAGEFVQFQCATSFMVVLPADPEVELAGPKNPVEGADPNLPFFGVASFDKALNLFIVNVKVSSGAGAQDQIFYKMYFIVEDDKGSHFVDPDFDTP